MIRTIFKEGCLHKLLEDIESGKEPLYDWEESEKEIDEWIKKLENESN